MAYYLRLSNGFVDQLASTEGYARLLDWIDRVPVKRWDCLQHLADHGWTSELDRLEAQLDWAMAQFPPGDEALAHTLDQLRNVVRNRGKARLMTWFDGTHAADDHGGVVPRTLDDDGGTTEQYFGGGGFDSLDGGGGMDSLGGGSGNDLVPRR